MNTAKVTELINQLIAEQQQHQVTRKQYPVSKAQISKLTELGILNLMPAKFGYTDAEVVIEAAITAKSAIMNAFGEGEEIPANPLNVALTTIDTEEETKSGFKAGDVVRVKPHTQYGDLRGGAVHSDMHEHRHNGYHNVVVESIAGDGSVEVLVPGYGIDIVDVSTLEALSE